MFPIARYVALIMLILLSCPALPHPLPSEYLPSTEAMLHSANQAAANSVPCIAPTKFKGAMWWGMGTLAILIILFTGLLAGLTLGVMGIDSTRLRVWTNTGSSERRY